MEFLHTDHCVVNDLVSREFGTFDAEPTRDHLR
jgi:hypothetical protein